MEKSSNNPNIVLIEKGKCINVINGFKFSFHMLCLKK